jgi:hypothetical protein
MVHALLEKMILLDGAGGDLCQVFAYCHGESATTDPTGDQLAEHCTVSRRLVTRAITAEQANGTVGADLDSEVTAEALAAMADGIGLPAFADGVFPARRQRQVVSKLLHLLRPYTRGGSWSRRPVFQETAGGASAVRRWTG